MNKVVACVVLAGAVVLAGCSSKSEKIDTLSTQVADVSEKVDILEQDVQSLKQDVLVVRGDAARANQRLDNQVKTFKK